MNVIRQSVSDPILQRRILENFWESQLTSKTWMLGAIEANLDRLIDGNVFVFGGWHGIAATLLADTLPVKNVYSIDIDPNCSSIGSSLSNNDPRITFLTRDMKDFNRDEYTNPVLIINTSTEHVTQDVFDAWLAQTPEDVPIILQGNNYFACEEHVRCSRSLRHFNEQNPLSKILFTGSLQCDPFVRYMTIGYR